MSSVKAATLAVTPSPTAAAMLRTTAVTASKSHAYTKPVDGSVPSVVTTLTSAPHVFKPPHTPHESRTSGGLQHTPDGGKATGQL